MEGEIDFDGWREMLLGFGQQLERLVLVNEHRFFGDEGSGGWREYLLSIGGGR